MYLTDFQSGRKYKINFMILHSLMLLMSCIFLTAQTTVKAGVKDIF